MVIINQSIILWKRHVNLLMSDIHVTMTKYITNLHQIENTITQNNVYEDRF